ncbi:T9SS type A sorting domain-containing protein [Rhodocaloribacter litoris]|uniref:T9SS type A sorting domain-containing protein n=1 Tax=Rhodocaloribacter litoris TaxID=2558931 RepID=UPI00141F5696|nr:FlgD immunoglobulin-like domain containing protein [Rhodocaloribacter litoris]QXD15617.1 T9SS type A sorting domain-containing protein [Rhodocaloribacter litoris]
MPAPVRSFLRIYSVGDLAVKIQDERIVLPSDYRLEQNYPNPFNGTTVIRFTLPLDKRVSVKVYDMTGRLVKTIVNDQLLPKGAHEVNWDGTSDTGIPVASGSYLYTLEYGNFRQSKTMVLLK